MSFTKYKIEKRREHLMINNEDFNNYLKDLKPIIVLDSSSLLDLYRYGPDTSKSLLDLYRKEIENIWLPQQVHDEFLKNSNELYQAQFNQFKKIATGVERSVNTLETKLNKSLLNAKTYFYPQVNNLENTVRQELERLRNISTEYEESIQSEIQASYDYFRENNPQLLINELHSEGKIGPGFTKFEKISIFTEGEVRYRLEFPPGYKDTVKDKDDKLKIDKFGDLVIWKEILRKAKEEQRSMLFITSDVKEDWWTLNDEGKAIDMHPLLIEEFVNTTDLSADHFLMLPTVEFLKLMFQRIQMHDMAEKLIMLQNVYTLDAEVKANEVLSQHNIIDSIEEELNLTASFIHDGELQEFIPDVISDVDVLEISEFEIIESAFYKKSDMFIIESIAEALCDVEVDVRAMDNMNVTYEYNIRISFNIQIAIPIKSVEEVIEENSPSLSHDIDEGELLETENIDFSFSNLNIIDSIEKLSPYNDDVCTECNNNYGRYFKNDGEAICESCSSSWALCPDCGLFYPEGSSSGAFCENCEEQHL